MGRRARSAPCSALPALLVIMTGSASAGKRALRLGRLSGCRDAFCSRPTSPPWVQMSGSWDCTNCWLEPPPEHSHELAGGGVVVQGVAASHGLHVVTALARVGPLVRPQHQAQPVFAEKALHSIEGKGSAWVTRRPQVQGTWHSRRARQAARLCTLLHRTTAGCASRHFNPALRRLLALLLLTALSTTRRLPIHPPCRPLRPPPL